jgi:type IV pilus assembly protein PilN
MKISLNLATRIYINRRALYAFYVLLAVLLVFWLGLSLSSWQAERAEIVRLEEQLHKVRSQLGSFGNEETLPFDSTDYQALLKDLAFAEDILARDAFRWTRLFLQLEQLMPEGASLRSLRPEHRERALSLTAVARENEQMNRFIDHLMASEGLNQVFLLSQERIEVKDFAGQTRPAVRFSLLVQEAF